MVDTSTGASLQCVTRYTEADLNVGEMACVDRCSAKFMEASQLVAEATTKNAEQVKIAARPWKHTLSPPSTYHSTLLFCQAQKLLQSQQAILGK